MISLLLQQRKSTFTLQIMYKEWILRFAQYDNPCASGGQVISSPSQAPAWEGIFPAKFYFEIEKLSFRKNALRSTTS